MLVMARRELQPLIPIDKLKETVKALLSVPKAEVDATQHAHVEQAQKRGRKPRPAT